MLKSIGLLVISALPVLAQDAAISAERIREHTRFLSSDLLEGRGTGHARRPTGHRIYRDATGAGRGEAGGRQRDLLPAGAAGGRRDPADRDAGRGGVGQGPGLPMGRRFRGQQPDAASRHALRRRGGIRGARDHGAGVQVGRLQRRRCDRQGAGDVHQRAAVGRSEILRRARAHLLRPLGLQIRRGAAARGEGVHPDPHDADGQLRVGRGAQLLGQGGSVRETGGRGRRRCRSRGGSRARRARNFWRWRGRIWTSC